MPVKQRKIEVHRLTISGLPNGTGYGPFLHSLRNDHPVATMVMKSGGKSHALNDTALLNHRLRLRFLSYTKGHRPDILDTTEFSVQENPLTPSQTSIEWTHALGAPKGGRYALLIEHNHNGIWPSTMEGYLQWLIDGYYQPSPETEQQDSEPVTVSIEAEPGPEFVERMDALEHVTEATLRIVRPNPGWHDLETELGEKAEESDAHKVDIKMTARRRASLSKNGGILGRIREAFHKKERGFAAITGRRGRRKESFTTERLGKHFFVNIEMDDRGQIRADDAWHRLSEIMDDLD